MDWSRLLTGFAAKFMAGTNIFEENSSTMNDFMTLRWEGEREGRREGGGRNRGRTKRGRQREEGRRKDREKERMGIGVPDMPAESGSVTHCD